MRDSNQTADRLVLLALRRGFSVLELIFVIVVLGIVASIGSQIIARVYEQYITQKAQHLASVKVELAAQQIANRLRYAIAGTVYRIAGGALEPIDSPLGLAPNAYTGIQWVGYDADSFDAAAQPGWSGFCDLRDGAYTPTTIPTPGSNLTLTDTIIRNLSGGACTLTGSRIYFPNDNTAYQINGWAGGGGVPQIQLAAAPATMKEQYKLAWSSYRVDVRGGDLWLDYALPPLPPPLVGNAQINPVRLMRQVSSFKFTATPAGVRFKLCKQDTIAGMERETVTACTEKVVF
jgi:prepilin-type N-terminal cleavage/methylation domain-containing protein